MGGRHEHGLAVAAVGYRHCGDIVSTQWRQGLSFRWYGLAGEQMADGGGCLLSTHQQHPRLRIRCAEAAGPVSIL